ncbi:MerR family transcriptional regulator [Pyruvatibacter sp.]|uniref:MerR family transcriptional regulator n=1 Tax=Pyruvatibacter sp. TaxID=1981328 RepID=UPI0032654E67
MNVQKSPDAFRTISEVAMDLDVPQHVLRFWETKFTQIKPLKRGGGRRYYRPEDVDLLRGIRTLLYHDGYTIKGVQKVFREQGVRHVSEIGREEYAAELAEAEAAGEGAEPLVEEPVPAAPAPASTQHVAPAPFPPVPLTEDQQIELELLLEELEGLKAKLENARAATWF